MPDRAAEPTVDGECHAELAGTTKPLVEFKCEFMDEAMEMWGEA